MNTAIKQLLSYQKSDWMVGQEKIDSVQHQLQRLIDIADAVKHFERKYEDDLQYSEFLKEIGQFPAHRKYVRSADTARRAAKRMRQYWNNIHNDMSL